MTTVKKMPKRMPQQDLANLIAHLTQFGYIKNPALGQLGGQMGNPMATNQITGLHPAPHSYSGAPTPMPVPTPPPHSYMGAPTPMPVPGPAPHAYGAVPPPSPQPMPQPGMTIHSDPRMGMQGVLAGSLPQMATYGGGPNIQGATPDAAKLAAIQSFLSPPRR